MFDESEFPSHDYRQSMQGCAPVFYFGMAICVVAAVLITFAVNDIVWAHEATNVAGQPLGWNYPWACCSNMDCKSVNDADVHEGPSGYSVAGSTDADPISYQDKRVKQSPDGGFHWCAHQAGLDVGKTICLFVPPKGM